MKPGMAVDPRTPVIVGAGQVNHDGGDSPEPAELLALAAERAAADAGSDRVLGAVESIRVVRILSRRYRDPGALVAERIGATPSHTAVTTDGGNSPQMLINATALAILDGDLDVALIGGAEAWKTRMSYKARGEAAPWTFQSEDVAPADVMGRHIEMSTQLERDVGLVDPLQVYPLFEAALRFRAGRGLEEHRRHIAGLWSRFGRVAAENPFAAVRTGLDDAAIGTPGDHNRMIGYPYTKFLCANNSVDQAAALLMCSAGRARALGISPDRWIFLHSGAEAHDTPSVSRRADLASSPAIRAVGRAVFGLAGAGPGDLAHVDLYSCFPSAVQVAAAELGLTLERDLTVTGGLTFAGGPWNNYVTHAVATMAGRLREDPAALGLCTANGGFLTKHAAGIYAAHPPATPVRVADVQGEVDAAGGREAVTSFDGPAAVEAYTVMHRRSGEPDTAYLACLLDDGRRCWAKSADPGLLAEMMAREFCGSRVRVGPDASLKGVAA
jgi:acetyl-CoA C-acetyltransferase